MKQIDQSVIGDALPTAGPLLSKAERTARLKALARTRRETDLAGLFGKNAPLYAHIGDFHSGVYECDDVSPWTKSGGDVDADFMIVGQDWSSYTQLEKPVNRHMVDYGFDPDFPTNRNLDRLLECHLHIDRRACYLTNLFPFIKAGNATGPVAMPDLRRCARAFLIPQIDIIRPRAVICLGQRTHWALMRALGRTPARPYAAAIEGAPYAYNGSRIFAVAHAGSFGMMNRGAEQVERDWARIATIIEAG